MVYKGMTGVEFSLMLLYTDSLRWWDADVDSRQKLGTMAHALEARLRRSGKNQSRDWGMADKNIIFNVLRKDY